jgi:hypothetical protein
MRWAVYPAVFTFAMLFAIARWRAARPSSALFSAFMVTESNTDVPFQNFKKRRPIRGQVVSYPCSVLAIGP